MTRLNGIGLQEEDDLLRRQFAPTPPDAIEASTTTVAARNLPLSKEEQEEESREREEAISPVAIGDSDTPPPEDKEQPETVDPKKLHPGLAAIQRRNLEVEVRQRKTDLLNRSLAGETLTGDEIRELHDLNPNIEKPKSVAMQNAGIYAQLTAGAIDATLVSGGQSILDGWSIIFRNVGASEMADSIEQLARSIRPAFERGTFDFKLPPLTALQFIPALGTYGGGGGRQADGSIDPEKGTLGGLAAEGSGWVTVGEFGGMLLPSLIGAGSGMSSVTIIAKWGPRIALAYMGMQAFGGGVGDYRRAIEAQGGDPDKWKSLAIGVGYGISEILFEKWGMKTVTNVAKKAIQDFGDAMLSGNYAKAAILGKAIFIGGGAEAGEEALTQIAQNLIAGQGFLLFSSAFDPTRSAFAGVPEASLMGFLGGNVVTTFAIGVGQLAQPAAFRNLEEIRRKQLREQVRRRQVPSQEKYRRLARNAAVVVGPLESLDDGALLPSTAEVEAEASIEDHIAALDTIIETANDGERDLTDDEVARYAGVRAAFEDMAANKVKTEKDAEKNSVVLEPVELTPAQPTQAIRERTPLQRRQSMVKDINEQILGEGSEIQAELVEDAGNELETAADALFGETGTEVIFISIPLDKDGKTIPGFVDKTRFGRRIFVNVHADSQHMATRVLSHEFVHILEETQGYAEFVATIRQNDPDALRDAGLLYASEAGIPANRVEEFLASERGQREAAARYVQQRATTRGFWDAIRGKQPGVIARWLAKADRWLARVGNQKSRVRTQEIEAMVRLARSSMAQTASPGRTVDAAGESTTQFSVMIDGSRNPGSQERRVVIPGRPLAMGWGELAVKALQAGGGLLTPTGFDSWMIDVLPFIGEDSAKGAYARWWMDTSGKQNMSEVSMLDPLPGSFEEEVAQVTEEKIGVEVVWANVGITGRVHAVMDRPFARIVLPTSLTLPGADRLFTEVWAHEVAHVIQNTQAYHGWVEEITSFDGQVYDQMALAYWANMKGIKDQYDLTPQEQDELERWKRTDDGQLETAAQYIGEVAGNEENGKTWWSQLVTGEAQTLTDIFKASKDMEKIVEDIAASDVTLHRKRLQSVQNLFDKAIEQAELEPITQSDGSIQFAVREDPLIGRRQINTMRQTAIENSGISFDVFTNKAETTGFSVSSHPAFEERIHTNKGDREIKVEVIEAYLLKHEQFLRENPDSRFGAWYEPSTGDWYLDIIEVLTDRQEAIDVARAAGQKAIFDLDKLEEIRVLTDAEYEAARATLGDAEGVVSEGDRGPDESGDEGTPGAERELAEDAIILDDLFPLTEQEKRVNHVAVVQKPLLDGDEEMIAQQLGELLMRGQMGQLVNARIWVEQQGFPEFAADKKAMSRIRGRGKAVKSQLTALARSDRPKKFRLAPPDIKTNGDVTKLVNRLMKMTVHGTVGRFWYEESGKRILSQFGGDPVQAEAFIQLIAIFSATNPLLNNWQMSAIAWLRNKMDVANHGTTAAGRDYFVGRYGWQARAADALMNDGTIWRGRKTGSFYKNLMRAIDGGKGGIGDPANFISTIDVWMMRSMGYGADAPTTPQYKYAEGIIERVMNKLNKALPEGAAKWEAHQVQAAIWTSIKARTPTEKQRKDTPELIDRHGLMPFSEKALDTNVDYTHISDWQTGFVIVNAVPHESTGVLPELRHSRPEVQAAFTSEALAILYDENGFDILARMLGLLKQGNGINGTGMYRTLIRAEFDITGSELASKRQDRRKIAKKRLDAVKTRVKEGSTLSDNRDALFAIGNDAFFVDETVPMLTTQTNKDWKTMVRSAIKHEKRGQSAEDAWQVLWDYTRNVLTDNQVSVDVRKLTNIYMAGVAQVLQKPFIMWYRPFRKASKLESNGVLYRMDRQMTFDEHDAITVAVHSEFDGEVFINPVENGVELVYTGDAGLKFEGNKDFIKRVKPLLERVISDDTDATLEHFATDHDQLSNDYEENLNGENYQREISAAGRSDVQRVIEDVLQPRWRDLVARYRQDIDSGKIDTAPREGDPDPAIFAATGPQFSQFVAPEDGDAADPETPVAIGDSEEDADFPRHVEAEARIQRVRKANDTFNAIVEAGFAIARLVPENRRGDPAEVLDITRQAMVGASSQVRQFKDRVETTVQAIIDAAANPKTGKFDAKKLDKIVTELREDAGDAAKRAAVPMTKRLREAMRKSTITPDVGPSELMKLHKIEKADQRQIAKDTRDADRKRFQLEAKEVIARKTMEQREIKGRQRELENTVIQMLPIKHRPSGILRRIGSIQTKEALQSALKEVLEALNTVEKRDAKANLLRQVSSIVWNSLPVEYRTDMAELVGEINFKRITAKTRDKLQVIADTIEAMPELEETFTKRERGMLKLLSQKDIDEMTTEDMNLLAEAIGILKKLAKHHGKVLKRGRLVRINLLEGAIVGELVGNSKPPRGPLPSGGRPPSGRSRNPITFVFKGENALKPDTMAHFQSGQEGIFWETFYKDLTDAQRNWLKGHQGSLDVMEEVLAANGFGSHEQLTRMSRVAAGTVGRWNRALAGEDTPPLGETKAEVVRDPEDGEIGILLESGKRLAMVPMEQMYLAALLEDMDNYDLIVNSGAPVQLKAGGGETFVLSREDVLKIRRSMSEAEWNVVNALVGHVNGPIKQRMQEWSRESRGRDITKLDLWWSRHRVRENIEVAVGLEEYVSNTLDSIGLGKDRGDDRKSPVEIRDLIVEYQNISWGSYALTEMADTHRTAKTMLNRTAVKAAIENNRRGKNNHKYWSTVLQNLAREATGQSDDSGAYANLISGIVNNMTKALLAANPRVIMYQPASLLMANTEIEMKYLIGAAAHSVMVTFPEAVGASEAARELDDEIRRGSPYLRARFDATAMSIMNETVGGTGREIAKGQKKRLSDRLMLGIQWGDRLAIRGIWLAATAKVEHEMKELSGQEKIDKIAEIAERVVQRTQPVWGALHASGIGNEARNNPFLKLITMFMAQRNQNINILARSLIRFSNDPSEWAKSGKDMGLVVVGQTMFIAGIGAFWEWVLGGFDDDDEEEFLGWVGAKAIDTLVGNVYFGSTYAAFTKQMVGLGDFAFTPDSSPLAGIVESTFRASAAITDYPDIGSQKWWKGVEDATTNIAALSPYGTWIAPYRMISRAWKNKTGDKSLFGGIVGAKESGKKGSGRQNIL